MNVKLILLNALLEAITRMLSAVAAINSDDFESAEAELLEVRRILVEQAQELRAA